ncbi:MAG: hypothetical protein GY788_22200 [bacterium]|nr:hypothetical protein [bacterium]
MRHTTLFVVVLAVLWIHGPAQADQDRCAEHFPGLNWMTVDTEGPVTVATAGMPTEMATRFAADVTANAILIEREIGGLEGTVACLATPELAPAFSDFAAPGQRLHAGVFGEEKVFVISAVEIRTVDDAIAFGLPHIALSQIAQDLDLEDGYPEPLGSTIAHWYLARYQDRLDRYRSELAVPLFLDDPNPDLRTLEDATPWTLDRRSEPFFYDPQFVASPMGVFVDYATATRGLEVIRDPSQETWGTLENQWRVVLREEFPEGDFGAYWGMAIVAFFLLLASLLAWLKWRQNKLKAQRKATPPADERLFVSGQE